MGEGRLVFWVLLNTVFDLTLSYLLLCCFILSASFSSAQPVAVQQWVQFYNGPDSLNDGSFSISIDILGYTYVTGASQVPPFTPQVYKITTVKYSPAGAVLWVATYDSISNASFKAIAMKVDANCILHANRPTYPTGMRSTDYTVN